MIWGYNWFIEVMEVTEVDDINPGWCNWAEAIWWNHWRWQLQTRGFPDIKNWGGSKKKGWCLRYKAPQNKKFSPNFSQRTRKLKKSSDKKNSWNQINQFFFSWNREIAFMAVLNFFPVQILIFGQFWNGKKWNLIKKFFVKLISSISQVF